MLHLQDQRNHFQSEKIGHTRGKGRTAILRRGGALLALAVVAFIARPSSVAPARSLASLSPSQAEATHIQRADIIDEIIEVIKTITGGGSGGGGSGGGGTGTGGSGGGG